MLRDWINKRPEIKKLLRGTRKNRTHADCQEPELKTCLLELFKEFRKKGRRINKRWFVQQGKEIYGILHPDHVVKHPGKLTQYSGFKFSNGWFKGFQKRARINF